LLSEAISFTSFNLLLEENEGQKAGVHSDDAAAPAQVGLSGPSG